MGTKHGFIYANTSDINTAGESIVEDVKGTVRGGVVKRRKPQEKEVKCSRGETGDISKKSEVVEVLGGDAWKRRLEGPRLRSWGNSGR